MAYTEFPAYAQLILDGYAERAGGGVQRDEMEDGFVHQAPTNSLSRYERSLTYRLADVFRPGAKTAFEHWRRHDLRNGALHFDWLDPADGQRRRIRIVGGEVEYEPLTNLLDDWSASFTIEYWE